MFDQTSCMAPRGLVKLVRTMNHHTRESLGLLKEFSAKVQNSGRNTGKWDGADWYTGFGKQTDHHVWYKIMTV